MWEYIAASGPAIIGVVAAIVSIRSPGRAWHWPLFVAFIFVGFGTSYATLRVMWDGDEQSKANRDLLLRIASAVGASKNASPEAILARVNALENSKHSREWPLLSPDAARELAANLRLISGKSIMIGCAAPECKSLAEQFRSIFYDANWRPSLHLGGGLGIDGVVGVRVDSCDGSAPRIAKLIEEKTPLLANSVDTPLSPCTAPTDLTVGIKPF